MLAIDTQNDTVIQGYCTHHLQLHTFSTHLHFHLSPILVVMVLHLLTPLHYHHHHHHHHLHLHHQIPCKTIKSSKKIEMQSTYVKSALFRVTNIVQSDSTKPYFFFTSTFMGVRLSGRLRSFTLLALVYARFTFSFCISQVQGLGWYIFTKAPDILTQSRTAKFILMLNVTVEK